MKGRNEKVRKTTRRGRQGSERDRVITPRRTGVGREGDVGSRLKGSWRERDRQERE